jgi:hypothetical protein
VFVCFLVVVQQQQDEDKVWVRSLLLAARRVFPFFEGKRNQSIPNWERVEETNDV